MTWLRTQNPTPPPLLVRPGGAAVGFVVVFTAFLTELVAGVITSNMSITPGLVALTVPAAIVIGLAIIQGWQVISSGADRAHWAHLVGVAIATFSWVAWPTVPGPFIRAGSVSGACASFFDPSAGCLRRVADAWQYHDLAWWLTGALILGAALITRWSRIAAWGSIVVSLAGCQLAMQFLQSVLVHYHIRG